MSLASSPQDRKENRVSFRPLPQAQGRLRESTFLDPSHFVRDDTPGVSLGDFAPSREKFPSPIFSSRSLRRQRKFSDSKTMEPPRWERRRITGARPQEFGFVYPQFAACRRDNFCSFTRRERPHLGDRRKRFSDLGVPRQIRHNFLLILRHQRRRLHSE